MAKAQDNIARIEALRAKIASLQEQRRTIEQAPLPRAETLVLIRETIAKARTEWLREHNMAAVIGYPPRQIGILHLDAPPAVLVPDQLEDALVEARDAQVGHLPDGLPARDRPQALADIDAQILEAEIAEETAIVEAERIGQAITRRADADPRAVLAVV